MSVIYSPNALEQNHYPGAASHQEAAGLLIEGIDEMVPEPGLFAPVTGALVYGSVAAGTTHRRSDVDLFIRIGHADEAANDETLDYLDVLLTDVERQTGVHVQANAHFESHPGTQDPFVNQDPFMTACIARAAATGSYISGEPAKGLLDVGGIPRRVLRNSALKSTMGFLATQRHVFSSGHGDLETLESALELPGALGRYMLCLRSLERDDGEYLAGKLDNKQQAVEYLRAEAEAASIQDQVTGLTAMDARCTDLTEAVISGDIPVADYRNWVGAVIPKAMRCAHELTKTAGFVLALRFDDLLGGKD